MHHAPHAAFRPGGRVDRVALISAHTCPLDQPGTGDAGGMNVAIREVARRLGELGVAVDVFTRDAGCPEICVPIGENARVVHLEAGPREAIAKDDVRRILPDFTMRILCFAEKEHGADAEKPPYDIVHANYWMGGRVGRAIASRWGVPFLQTFHTLGKVKNLSLAEGDTPEAHDRLVAEQKVVDEADMILAPTMVEAEELISLYSANPARVRVVSPGVDPDLFHPGPAEREALGWPQRRPVVLFVGRLQPLKQPDVAIRAVGAVAAGRSGSDRPVLVIVGGPSGLHGTDPGELMQLANSVGLGSEDVIWSDPIPHPELARAYRSATLTVMPSRTESFGLVALESEACGTPVVGSDVGGLRTAIRDGVTGLLAPVGDVDAFATSIARILDEPGLRDELAARAVTFAKRFDWRWVARGTLSAYEDAATAGARRSDLDLAVDQ